MKIVIGLGNPGEKFTYTRHNVGFMVIDRLASKLKVDSFESKWKGMVGKRFVKGEEIYLVKPTTYMNLSGKCVKSIMDDTAVGLQDILVVLDDVELPIGTIRIRARGSSGGHNGLQSIIDECASEDFPRLRVGIGKPSGGVDLVDYVLSNFEPHELRLMETVVDKAVDAVICWIFEGVENAMSKFNRNYLIEMEENGKETNKYKEEKNE